MNYKQQPTGYRTVDLYVECCTRSAATVAVNVILHFFCRLFSKTKLTNDKWCYRVHGLSGPDDCCIVYCSLANTKFVLTPATRNIRTDEKRSLNIKKLLYCDEKLRCKWLCATHLPFRSSSMLQRHYAPGGRKSNCINRPIDERHHLLLTLRDEFDDNETHLPHKRQSLDRLFVETDQNWFL